MLLRLNQILYSIILVQEWNHQKLYIQNKRLAIQQIGIEIIFITSFVMCLVSKYVS